MSYQGEGVGVPYELQLDKLIARLREGIDRPGELIPIEENECVALCSLVTPILEKEPMLLELDAPIKVCGDLHGQFYDLLRLLELCNHPPQSRYLFLGDYVDRGPQSIEILCLLFAYKIKYPDHIYLLRGNHEIGLVNRVYGFREEIRNRYGKTKLRQNFLHVFNVLPIAAIVEKSIFCCHGGLSPYFLEDHVSNLIELLNSTARPTDVPREGFLCDLVWADPADMPMNGDDPMGWRTSPRGCSWHFGYDVIDQFLDKFGLDLIVRGHQVVEDGYEFYHDRKLITVFSAPNYCNQFDNAGGVFVIRREDSTPSVLEGGFQVIKPDKNRFWSVYGKDTSTDEDE
ncbi:unnamed protein product [Schistocephalus solidus]|uniref:Serine/threonine-protein phosphatase n=1 Tax=Schistocephalus solidus TaxID=70667 RepID=A0A183T028_SCHSO|nr:unnamed protein product [Schistocephalus solidus]